MSVTKNLPVTGKTYKYTVNDLTVVSDVKVKDANETRRGRVQSPLLEYFTQTMEGFLCYAVADETGFYGGYTTKPSKDGAVAGGNSHLAIDFGVPAGNRWFGQKMPKLFSPVNGKVTARFDQIAKSDTNRTNVNTLGNYVVVTDSDGHQHSFEHLEPMDIPAVGATVTAGKTLLGYMGSTGDSTGCHCHYSITVNGARVNPYTYWKAPSDSNGGNSTGGSTTPTTNGGTIVVQSYVTVKSGAVWGGLAANRGKAITNKDVFAPSQHRVRDIKTHNGVQEALLGAIPEGPGISSWIALSSLDWVGGAGANPAPTPITPIPTPSLMRVQIGAFSKKENAEKCREEAVAKGFKDAFITDNGDGLFRVQIGAYSVQANAENAVKTAAKAGYNDAYIVGVVPTSPTTPVAPVTPNPAPVVVTPSGKTVGIAIGHGGADGGAVSGAFVEKNMNLTVGLRLRDRLHAHGIATILNRTTDAAGREAAFAAEIVGKVDIAVAVHFNAFADPSANGFEVGQNRNSNITASTKLCQLILKYVLEDVKGIRNRGVKTYNFAMTNQTYPAAYCEGGFITSPTDQKFYDTTAKLHALAEAYCKAICENFGIAYKKA